MPISNELIGKQILGAQVIRRLARGTHTEVFQAEHLSLGRPVALKVYADGAPDMEEALRKFVGNAQVLTTLEHPNLVAYLDAGKHEGSKAILQAYVDGETLGSRLKRQGVIEPAIAAALFRDLARGLEAIHATGLAHGDLKPENVLLSKKGDIKISDFGIARAIPEAGGAVGTPEYLAPEWAQDPTPAADMYALGVMFFRVLAGHLPFTGDAATVVKAHREQPIPSAKGLVPDLSDRMALLCVRLLAKNPADRPTAAQAAIDFDVAGREARGEVVPGLTYGQAEAPAPHPELEIGMPGEVVATPADAPRPSPAPAAPMWSLPAPLPPMDAPTPDPVPAQPPSGVRRVGKEPSGDTKKRLERGYVPASPLPEAQKVGSAVVAPLPKPTQSYGGFKPKRVSKLPKMLGFLVLAGAVGAAGWYGWKQVEPLLAAKTQPNLIPAGPPPPPPDPLAGPAEDMKRSRYLPALVKIEAVVKEKATPEGAAMLLEAGRKYVEQSGKKEMVFVPAGKWKLGGNGPETYVRSFLMDAREVTVGQYAEFLEAIKATGHDFCHVMEPAGKSHVPDGWKVSAATKDLPVTGVDWFDAYAFADWKQKRLPYEAEWERAATWTADGPVKYPWGHEWKAGASNIVEGDASLKLAVGGTFLEDRTGCWVEDMAGNVSEWCFDAYGLYPSADKKLENPFGPKSGDTRVVRGGSWGTKKDQSESWQRWDFKPATRSDKIGIRCVKDLKRD